MPGESRFFDLKPLVSLLVLALGLGGCSSSQPPARPERPKAPAFVIPNVEAPGGVMLGIDVLESQGFSALRGKRVGLLTHPAGVDHRGVSTIDILRRAPGFRLIAL